MLNAQLFNPDGTAAGAGGPQNTVTQPRDIQFALKVIWQEILAAQKLGRSR